MNNHRVAKPEPQPSSGVRNENTPATPLIWVLRSTGTGADRQLFNLAGALGGRVRVIDTLDGPLRALVERLTGAERRPIPPAKRHLFKPPWPDLVLFSGGRSLVDALRIRRASGGHSRVVCIGRTGSALDRVDLVLTTPQYGLPEHSNVVHLDLPLNFVDQAALDAGRRAWRDQFRAYPRPWHGVLLGGPSGSYRFASSAAKKLGDALQRLIARNGGSLLITTSPRSPPDAIEAMLSRLETDHLVYRWRADADDNENPLHGILALADDFVVTSDSASMLAEACWIGRPVAVFEPPLRWRAKLLERLEPRHSATTRTSRRAYWTVQGRWIPARRMERIHRQLASRGLITPIEKLAPDASPALGGAGDHDLERVVAAVRRLLERR